MLFYFFFVIYFKMLFHYWHKMSLLNGAFIIACLLRLETIYNDSAVLISRLNSRPGVLCSLQKSNKIIFILRRNYTVKQLRLILLQASCRL